MFMMARQGLFDAAMRPISDRTPGSPYCASCMPSTTRSKPRGSTASGVAASSWPGNWRESISTRPLRPLTGNRTSVPSRLMRSAVPLVQTSVTAWLAMSSLVASSDPYEAPRMRTLAIADPVLVQCSTGYGAAAVPGEGQGLHEAALLDQLLPNFGRLNCGGTPIRQLISHCCAIDSTLFVIQYSTRPAGKKKNMTENASGMIHIILACTGSGGAGFSAVCSSVVSVITAGRMKNGSGEARSRIQPIHGALRISTVDSSTQYSAMNTGICTRIGRQPPSGLTFSSL